MTQTSTDTPILLEDYVPYDESLKWTIHHNYFQQRGSKAWLMVEVPYYVTSNTAAALQNAAVIHAAIGRMQEAGILREGNPIPVLELASGMGLFAINFLKMLGDLDRENGTDYRSRVRYYFTDYSRQNILDASNNPVLQRLQEEGALHFRLVNALEPERMQPLVEGEASPRRGAFGGQRGEASGGGQAACLPAGRFVAVIANYLHCCLPLTILRKKEGALYEKHIRLSLKTDPAVSDKDAYCREAIEHPLGKQVLQNLVEETSWQTGARFRDVLHRGIVEGVIRDFDVATVVYPYGSLQSLARTFPLLLEGGVILISDKGYASCESMRGERECAPSIHGNSFAHSLNVPLLELFAEKLGYCSSRTTDPAYSLQTICMEKRGESELRGAFEEQFVESNRNLEASDFYQSARKYQNEGNYEIAARFYRRTLERRPYDAPALYHLAECYGELGRHGDALSSCEEGKTCDYFSEYDFSFRSGLALHNLGKHEEALEKYLSSLESEGEHEVTHYNIGRCLENLGNRERALQSYEKACSRNPQYEKARRALEELTEARPR